MNAEQWVVILADPSGQRVSGNGPIEHAAHRRAVDVLTADAKADEASGEHIHDQQGPNGCAAVSTRNETDQRCRGYPWPVGLVAYLLWE